MWASAITAYLHYLSLGVIFAALAIEYFTLKEDLEAKEAWRILWADSAYGIAAVTILVTGLLRVFYYGKGTAYYTAMTTFWLKVGLFLVVGMVSLYPTFSFLLWLKSLIGEKPAERVKVLQYRRLKGIIVFELIGFSIIPLLASMMARGIGLSGGLGIGG